MLSNSPQAVIGIKSKNPSKATLELEHGISSLISIYLSKKPSFMVQFFKSNAYFSNSGEILWL
jgi:hypothetical protein